MPGGRERFSPPSRRSNIPNPADKRKQESLTDSQRHNGTKTVTVTCQPYSTSSLLCTTRPQEKPERMTVSKFADDDLRDLIGDGKGRTDSEIKPLNLDNLSQGDLDVPVKRTSAGDGCRFLRLCCAYIVYTCECAPGVCCSLGVLALVVSSYLLVMAVFLNPTEHFGIVNDYTDITSQYDLTLGKIDHWCLKGDNESCRCEDPLDPQARGEFRAWARAQVANTQYVNSLIAAGKATPDIAFVGGSIVESMGGKWFGKGDDDNLKTLKKTFDKYFKKESGATLDAVTLGIAGDTNPTVLWRLINGEMPTAFNPKIWWLEIGLNDLGRSQCSEEVVVLGVLRIVEEILEKKNGAMVVINSLFPMADLRGGSKPGENDFKDGFDKSLRTRPTAKLNKERGRTGNGGNKVDKDLADAGDSTHISHLKDVDITKKSKKGGKKGMAKKRKGARTLEKIEGTTGHRQVLLGRTKEDKVIKMKDNKDTQKQFKPITHQERKLPLWTSITAVNRQLRRFAEKHQNVIFFDSTRIFTEREGGNTFILKTDMISIRGHPSPKGFEAWEKAIVERATSLLSDGDV